MSAADTGKLLKELEAHAKADVATARTIKLSDNAKKLKEAYSLMEEGVYQPSKYNKLVVEKEGVSLSKGKSAVLTEQDYINARILDRGSGQALRDEMTQRAEAWVGDRITLSEARKACKLNGSSLEMAIDGVGNAFEKIDARLGYDMKSDVAKAFGTGSGINTISNAVNGDKK